MDKGKTRAWLGSNNTYLQNKQSDFRLWIKINLKKNKLDLKELNLLAKIKFRTV